MKLNPFHLKTTQENMLGMNGVIIPNSGHPDFLVEGIRIPFVNRSTKGKTRRKRLYPSHGKKTNVGDPVKKIGSSKKK